MGNERAYGSGTPGAVGSPLVHLSCQCWQTTSPIPQPKVYHSHRHFPEQSWHHRCKCLFKNQSKQDAVPFQKGNQTMQQQGQKKVYVILHWWVVSCWVWKCPSSWCSRTHFASNRLLKKRSKVSLGNLCSRTFMTTHVLRHHMRMVKWSTQRTRNQHMILLLLVWRIMVGHCLCLTSDFEKKTFGDNL